VNVYYLSIDKTQPFAFGFRNDWSYWGHDRLAWTLEGTLRTPAAFSHQFSFLQDIDRCGEAGRTTRELYAYALRYSPLKNLNLTLDVGAGCAVLVTDETARVGPSGQISAEFYPLDPLIIHSTAMIATPAGKQVVGNLEASVGIIIDRFSVYAGWRAFLDSDSHDHGGPMAGLAFWF